MKTVASAFNDKGDANGVKKVQASGLHLAGEKFLTLRADDRSLYVKKVCQQLHHLTAGARLTQVRVIRARRELSLSRRNNPYW